jgi:uncharacterized delta-60 repeat protein
VPDTVFVEVGLASKRVLRLSALAAFLLLTVSAGAANPGDLDATFGSGGTVTTLIGSNESDARAVVVQPDGKIVVGGWAGSATLALARFKPNGTLDRTFGSGGKVTTSLVGAFDAAVYALALQPDGKIVAAGIDYLTQYESDFVVARYNADGSPDSTFGAGGMVTTDFDRLDAAHAVVVQPDHTIVAAGDAIGPGGPAVVLERYRPDGSFDPAFGSGGKVRSPGIGAGNGLVRQPDGKLVVAGTVAGGTGTEFAAVRFDPDGSLDTAFGSQGVATAPVGSSGVPFGIALQADGRLVAAGNAADSYGQSGWGVARWNPDGTLDGTFGEAGVVVTKAGPYDGLPRAVAVQRNGKIVTAGDSRRSPPDDSEVTVVRYQPNGSLDGRFGKHGIVTTSYGNVLYSYGEGLALQGDGKILVAGGGMNAGSPEVVGLVRLLGDTCVVPNVKRKPLDAARQAIGKAGCAAGKVTKAFSTKIAKGRVISQKPRAGARVATGTRVSLVVSKGKRRR